MQTGNSSVPKLDPRGTPEVEKNGSENWNNVLYFLYPKCKGEKGVPEKNKDKTLLI